MVLLWADHNFDFVAAVADNMNFVDFVLVARHWKDWVLICLPLNKTGRKIKLFYRLKSIQHKYNLEGFFFKS